MASAGTLDTAARMGARAGQSFLDTGIWPRCPFRVPAVADLERAWTDALFEVARPRMLAMEAARRRT